MAPAKKAAAKPAPSPAAPPPDEERTRDMSMAGHVKAVGAINIVTGILTALAGLAIVFAFGVADVAVEDTERFGTPRWVDDMMESMGWMMGIIALASAAVQVLAGMQLVGQKKAGKMTGILASALHVVAFWFFPFSTAIGVYGLVVLLNSKTDDALVNG